MDINSFVIGIVIAAIIAAFWHRDVMKVARMDYAEMREKWLVAEYGAEVVHSEGELFVAWIEKNKKFILFFEKKSLNTQKHADRELIIYARKWKNTINFPQDGPIWDGKYNPARVKNKK